MVAGGLLGAAAPGYALLLASRFLEGVGFILFVVAAAPLLAAATQPADRATAFSIWSSYMPTGGTLALLLAPLALAQLRLARPVGRARRLRRAVRASCSCGSVPPPRFGGGIGSLRLLAESLAAARQPGAVPRLHLLRRPVELADDLAADLRRRGARRQRQRPPRCCSPRTSRSTSSATSSAACCCARRAALGGDGAAAPPPWASPAPACSGRRLPDARAHRLRPRLLGARRRDPGRGVLRHPGARAGARSTSAPPTAWSCRPRTSSQFVLPDPDRLGGVARRRLGGVAVGHARRSPSSASPRASPSAASSAAWRRRIAHGHEQCASPHLRSRPARRAAERAPPDADRGEEGVDRAPSPPPG